MNESKENQKVAVLAELENLSATFNTLGIDHTFNPDGTLEELVTARNIAQTFFESITNSVIDDRDGDFEEVSVTLEILSEFVRDVSPEPEPILKRISDLASEPAQDLDETEQFKYVGLFETYEALGEQSLIMTTSDWDPSELVYLLNHMLGILNKEKIDDTVVEEIQEKLVVFEDDYEDQEDWVWYSIAKLLEERNLTLIQMTPMGGVWSDKALIVISKEKASRWVNKAFGGFALSPFSSDYLEIDWDKYF